MAQIFKGQLIKIEEIKTGASDTGEWASASFILKEFNPSNAQYPQIVKLDMFKNGEYVKYAKDFEQYYKVGDIVEASYNFKATKYLDKKDNSTKAFYSISCWKLEKVSEDVPQNTMGNESLSNNAPVQSGLEVADDLPF
jgi:hypothetical protein|tara:strand:- start:82 stop:498 length:417 start_codon:yes stop_codon:yes gene_type:complete